MIKDRNLLFCNIAYMQYYDSTFKEEIPQNGGKYIKENKTGYEINNFYLHDDSKYYGFVEPGFSNGNQKELHIENINGAYKGKDIISDVTVVFCATSSTGPVIVGWYCHATVYRNMQKFAEDSLYNIVTDAGNAVLLYETDRTMKVPRANSDGYGFGQSNVWYANQDDSRVQNYVDSVWNYIRNFSPEDNLIYNADKAEGEDIAAFLQRDIFTESGERKMIATNLLERNAKARNACLKRRGHRCLICGFDAQEVYGDAFAGKIHVHHIIPISQRSEKYQINPENDLIPVCPNCHMMLHTKVNGKYLLPEELKLRYKAAKKENIT